MAYTYSTFKTAIANLCAVDESDADFVAIFPFILDSAEQRIYRELDLVCSSTVVSGVMTPATRSQTIPSSGGHILVVDQVNVLDSVGTRSSLKPVSRDVIDFLFPTDTPSSSTAVPTVFARTDDAEVLVGPSPGSALAFEIVGTFRPAPLSVTNTSTYLSLYLSDLLVAAAMCAASGGLLKNYGAKSDDPASSMSWEVDYQMRLASARNEEARKNFTAMNYPLPQNRP